MPVKERYQVVSLEDGDFFLWKIRFDTSVSIKQAFSILKTECEILQLLHVMVVFLS